MTSKYLFILCLCLLTTNQLFSQAPDPTKEQVLKDAKSTYLLKQICGSTKRNFTSWAELTLLYKEFANGDNLYEPKFRTEFSKDAKRLDLSYHDLGYYYLVVRTPKDKDGVYYDVSIKVLYYKASQDANWTFKQSAQEDLNSYYVRGTEKLDKAALNKLIVAFKKYKGIGKKNDVGLNGCSEELKIIKIDTIYKNPNEEDRVVNGVNMCNYFLMKADVIKVENGKLERLYEGAQLNLILMEPLANKNAQSIEIGCYGTSNWKYQPQEAINELNSAGKSFKDLLQDGFEAVYKKRTSVERNQYNYTDLENNAAGLTELFQTFKNDITQGKVMLNKVILPTLPNKEDVIKSYVSFFEKSNAYFCELEMSNSKLKVDNVKDRLSKGELIYKVEPGLALKRAGAYGNKAVLKKYSNAGISKETLKNTGGSIYTTWMEEITLEFYNNKWYISSPLKVQGDFKFD